MKISSIIFLLAWVGFCSQTVRAASNPLNPSQDKPTRLYVASYTKNYDNDEHNTYVDYNDDGSVKDFGHYFEENHSEQHWKTGQGGDEFDSDAWDIRYGDGTTNVNGFAFQILWPASGDGWEYGYWDGDWVDDTNAPVPVWPWESGTLKYFVPLTGGPTQMTSGGRTYTYTGHTKIHLQTGGKGQSRRQNLFGLGATVTKEHYELKGNPVDELDLIPQTVPPQNIQILGENLNTNGYIYKILADNDDRDVTPQVNADYYTFSVGATKYLSYFEVFVDQPDPTGSSVWTHADAAGHAWWRLRTDAPGDAVNQFISSDLAHFLNDSVGYANTNTVNVYFWSPSAPGELRDPESDIYFSAYTNYDIGFPDLIGGLNYTKQLKDSPGTYNLWANNCVDKVIQAGAAAGVTVPNNKGPKSYSNPEFFGKSFQH